MTCSSFQDVCDAITALQSYLTATKLDVDDIQNKLYDYVIHNGTSTDENIQKQVNDATHGLAAIRLLMVGLSGDIFNLDLKVGTPITGSIFTHLEEIDVVVDDIQPTVNDIKDIVSTPSASFLVDFFNRLGGIVPIDIFQVLYRLSQDPGLGLMTGLTPILINSDNIITWSIGTYGLKIELNIPAYWGKDAGYPPVFKPWPARAAFGNSFGYTSDPFPIRTTPYCIYPIPSNAQNLTIHLETGITGYISQIYF